MDLTSEDKLILAGSKLHLTEIDIQRMENLIPLAKNWKSFTDMAIQNGVGPLIHKNFSLVKNFNLIPEETLSRLKRTYYRSLSRNMILYDHFRNAIDLFSKHGISIIALKGIFLAEKIYHDIGLRQMSDIDLLVRKEDIEKCRKLLVDVGYKYTELKKSDFINALDLSKHLPPLILNGVSFELHAKIHLDSPDFSVNIDDYWKRSLQVMLSGKSVRSLSSEDLILHICIHLNEHFDEGRPQLSSFVDISEVIKEYNTKINWDLVLELCNLYNCTSIIFRYLLLSEKYFDIKVPHYILQKASLSADRKDASIDVRTEKLFIYYLRHFRKDAPLRIVNRNIEAFNNIKGFRNKAIYLLNDLFPSRTFMYNIYGIKKKYLLFWYYLVRLKIGAYKFLLHIIGNAISLAKSQKKKKLERSVYFKHFIIFPS